MLASQGVQAFQVRQLGCSCCLHGRTLSQPYTFANYNYNNHHHKDDNHNASNNYYGSNNTSSNHNISETSKYLLG